MMNAGNQTPVSTRSAKTHVLVEIMHSAESSVISLFALVRMDMRVILMLPVFR